MKGNPKVIESLNALLAGELTAVDQYMAHSRKYRDWGFERLYQRIDHETLEEREHADLLIQRILFLEGEPDLVTRLPINVGSTVPEMLRNDLDVEYRVVTHLRQIIVLCESMQDFQTRDILLKLLKDTEEDHAWWLEKQLNLIEQTGLQNFLQSQVS